MTKKEAEVKGTEVAGTEEVVNTKILVSGKEVVYETKDGFGKLFIPSIGRLSYKEAEKKLKKGQTFVGMKNIDKEIELTEEEFKKYFG